MGVVEAIIASAVIGAGASAYSAKKQSDAQKDAISAQERARREAEAEARRVAMESKPEELGASLEIGGTTSLAKKRASTADFLIPRQEVLGGASTSSGLGFKV